MPQKKHAYYPLFLDVEERPVVIVGGGSVAARKTETLLRYGAQITVVAPKAVQEIETWASEGRVRLVPRRFEEDDLAGATLVFASTDDAEVNRRIAAACAARKIPVNVADAPALGDFILPAVIEQGTVQVAVSTGGSSPALARTLKRDLQQVIGPEYAELSDILGDLREKARSSLATDDDRKRFFDSIIAAGVLQLLRDGNRSEAYARVRQICETAGVETAESQSRRTS